jgi:phage terminase large subunit-like protein
MVSDYEALQAVCRQNFGAFVQKAFEIIEPGTDFEFSWHIDCIAEHLQAQFEGDEELKKLVINIPPRCLKSVEVAQIYPAWAMGREPHHQFIGASYAHTLAERNVMRCRQIMQSEFYQDTFTTRISQDQNQKDYFTTTEAGQYKGTGIGGTVTGFGARTLVIDDPVNPKEAASDTIRVNAINEIRSTLFSRFNKFSEGRMTLIMQRVHEQDPSGDLLKDGGCYHLKLPAENKGKTISYSRNGKSWEMEEGELLTPRLGRADLDELMLLLSEYNYVGQYLQEPVPLGGGDFREEWLQEYAQGSIKPREMNVVILMDQAGGEQLNKKKKKLSDWTVISVIGLASDNNYYLLDMVRDRFNPTDRVNTLFMLHRKWNQLCGKPPKVGVEQIGMMTDAHYIKEKCKQDAYHFSVTPVGGTQIKEERIKWLVPVMQQNRFYVPGNLIYIDSEGRRFDLIDEMKGEMRSFPRSRWDDILDTISRLGDVDLNLQFPKPKATMVQKAMRPRAEPDNWENW